MAELNKWQRRAQKAFQRKVAAAPASVLRNKTLREYLLVDFFHDAVFRKIHFDAPARVLGIELITCRKISPPYDRVWGLRLPKYEDDANFFTWKLNFQNVAHFSLNAKLTEIELENGRIKKEDWVFRDRSAHFDYVGGRFLSSRLLAQQQRDFKKPFLHFRMDCDIRIIDVIFEKFQLRREGRVPHKWRNRKQFQRYLMSA